MKFLNCLFLIVGTAIGTGILGIPVANPNSSFMTTSLSLFCAWFFMTAGSFMLLDSSLSHKKGRDLIYISGHDLGDFWRIIIGSSYLLLLYALLSVYILVGSSWLEEWTGSYFNLEAPQYQMIFTLLCSMFIYLGVHFVGSVNQILSAGVIVTLIILITLGISSVDSTHLIGSSNIYSPRILSVLVTAFGFAVIIPTLITYTNKDKPLLFKALLIGSIVILLLNLLWTYICFGVLGQDALSAVAESESEGPEIILKLQESLKTPLVGIITNYFAIFALFSSLIGVSLSLYHFLLDSFKLHKTKFVKINGIALTFTVPLLTLLIFPTGFVSILGFAGIFVSVVLGLLPAQLYIKKYKSSSFIKILPGYLTFIFFAAVIIIEISKYL